MPLLTLLTAVSLHVILADEVLGWFLEECEVGVRFRGKVRNGLGVL